MSRTINWKGQSGQTYKYTIYPIDPLPDFNAIAGNYAFAKETEPKTHKVLYFGETDNLSERFNNHHKWDECIRNGATHIHVHLSGGKQARLAEERDLIGNYNPICNG